jgi:hypothetical protein
MRLERLDEDLVVRYGEMVAAQWVNDPVAEASTSGSSGAVPESTVIAYVMEDVVHA